MRRRSVWGAAVAWLVLGSSPLPAQQIEKVTGRVLDPAGKPVEGVEVASMWSTGQEKKGEAPTRQVGINSVTTDADGRFTAKVTRYSRDQALMAIDKSQKLGGTMILPAGSNASDLEIRLAPLVKVHGRFASEKLGRPIGWTNVYINLLGGKIRLLQDSSVEAEFSMLLPPGEYQFNGYGADVTDVDIDLKLTADQPDRDLGTVEIPASFLALHKGKELPPWTIVDARGVKKDVNLADYRGKWVLVDFWGFWCGPCVVQMADMIDFYEDHADERDKFEILAFHDGSVKDFSEMDSKLESTKKSLWKGRDLPFPVLLDAPQGNHGVSTALYEIRSFPTTLAIDPEGKLVGEVSLSFLEKKLKPIPMAKQVSKALDRNASFGISGGNLSKLVGFLSQRAHVPITFDTDALKAAGINPDDDVPLKLSGSLSLRSWMELLLDPLGLEAVPGADSIRIVPTKPGATREPSEAQRQCAIHLAEVLEQKVTCDFKGATLEQVAAHFEGETRENFVLDPTARRAGRLDPETPVTGSAKDVPLKEALETLLKPLGMTVVIKDELFVLTKPATP